MGRSGAARAWKCGALERARAWNWGLRSWLVGRVSLILWPAITPGRCEAYGLAAAERLEGKHFENNGSSGGRSGKNSKMVMLRGGFLKLNLICEKLYALERRFRAENGGLTPNMAHTHYAHFTEVRLPPPPPPERVVFHAYVHLPRQ